MISNGEPNSATSRLMCSWVNGSIYDRLVFAFRLRINKARFLAEKGRIVGKADLTVMDFAACVTAGHVLVLQPFC
jgi:hypothetical protein